VREHIAEYGGDPELVCVTGGSAGGHLAAMVGLTANDPEYQPGFEDADTSVAACVPFYAVYDLVDLFEAGGTTDRARKRLAQWLMDTTPEEDPARFEHASPKAHVSADDPPFFVIHGSADNLVPVRQARAFVESLRAVSAQPVLYAEVPGASHAFDVFHSMRTDNAVAAVGRFLGWVVAARYDAQAAAEPPVEQPIGSAPAAGPPATAATAAGSPAP
jgi:acetyl esterase/lipase